MSAFEFCDLGPNRRFIWFHVAEDPQSSEAYRERARVAPGRSERRITGRFDVPLEDIAARLNDMRRRALGGAAEDEAARRLPAAGPAGTARVIFADAERNGTTAGLIVALVLVIIFGVDVLAVNSWIRWPILAFLAVAAIPVVLRLRVLLTGEGKPAPADNCLALNGEGLTVTRRGRSTTWSWRELSPFRAHATGLIGRALQCGFLVATVPDDARLLRFWRLAGRLLFRRPALVIADKYLARPEVIAATLNEYRERALGGGTKTDSPHAPTT